MGIDLCNKEANLSKAFEYAKKAIESGCEIILLPEVFSTGFCYENIHKLAEPIPGDTYNKMMECSREYSVIISGTIIEKFEDKLYNTCILFEDGDFLGKYRKTHLYGNEKNYFSHGNSLGIFETSRCKIGVIICYEIRFPELARTLALKGIDILLTPAQFPKPREEVWRTLVRARAIENQIFHCACNIVGEKYFGASLIVSPDGEILDDGKDKEKVVISNINLSEIKNIRKKIRVFSDRREELYF